MRLPAALLWYNVQYCLFYQQAACSLPWLFVSQPRKVPTLMPAVEDTTSRCGRPSRVSSATMRNTKQPPTTPPPPPPPPSTAIIHQGTKLRCYRIILYNNDEVLLLLLFCCRRLSSFCGSIGTRNRNYHNQKAKPLRMKVINMPIHLYIKAYISIRTRIIIVRNILAKY